MSTPARSVDCLPSRRMDAYKIDTQTVSRHSKVKDRSPALSVQFGLGKKLSARPERQLLADGRCADKSQTRVHGWPYT